jgi:hypothetical protein
MDEKVDRRAPAALLINGHDPGERMRDGDTVDCFDIPSGNLRQYRPSRMHVGDAGLRNDQICAPLHHKLTRLGQESLIETFEHENHCDDRCQSGRCQDGVQGPVCELPEYKTKHCDLGPA